MQGTGSTTGLTRMLDQNPECSREKPDNVLGTKCNQAISRQAFYISIAKLRLRIGLV